MSAPVVHVFPSVFFVDLKIYQFGHQQCDPFHGFGPHKWNHFLFHYVQSGRGQLRADDKNGQTISYNIEAGQGFIIMPQQMVAYSADEKYPWKYCWIEFEGVKAHELISQAGFTFNQPIYTGQNKEEHKKMEDALQYIINNAKASPFELMGYAYIFLSALAESSIYRKKISRSSLQDFYVQEILSFLESNYSKNIQVEDIAEFCKLDRSHVSKIFKNIIGMTLREFLLRFRMNKACELMKSSNYSIEQISSMVGYSSMFNFSRSFKSLIGKSPSHWRVENKLR